MALFDPLKTYNFTRLSLNEIRRLFEIKVPMNPLQFKDDSVKSKYDSVKFKRVQKWRIYEDNFSIYIS